MNVNSANFKKEVIESGVPVLVDFWAPWCGPCKSMAPIIEEVETELGASMKVAKVNVDENSALAEEHQILSIPTFVVFKGGQVVDQFSGSMNKGALLSRLEKHL